MIPGQFSYHRPRSLGEAAAMLVDLKPDARILAGGQSLIPMMKLRLAAPHHLIDLGAVSELKGIQRNGTTMVIGAMTTQAEIIGSKVVAGSIPLVREAALQIADPQVRYQGTIGGNCANGDPGNDMPAIMMVLDASYRLTGKAGSRNVKARDFYIGTYATELKDGEILSAIEIPVPAAGHGHAYEKLKRKIGDYATAAAAVVMTVRGGLVQDCAIGLSNLSDRALFASAASAAVAGKPLDKASIVAAVSAARSIMSPANDTRGTPEYRVHVGGSMVERALKSAFARAKG